MCNFKYVVNNTDYFDMNVQISRFDAGRAAPTWKIFSSKQLTEDRRKVTRRKHVILMGNKDIVYPPNGHVSFTIPSKNEVYIYTYIHNLVDPVTKRKLPGHVAPDSYSIKHISCS